MSAADEVAQLAISLARNCAFACFPCLESKAPAVPGPGGYKHGSTDPERIAWLWQRYPAPLIGVATGAVSKLWVIDVDVKHREGCDWWRTTHHRLLPTRTYATRSGGLHLYFRDGDGVGCSSGRICRGVDTRGDGGYVIHWFSAGLACHDHSPPAPWPTWLRAALSPPRPAVAVHTTHTVPGEAAVAGIVRRVAEAHEGERNAVLFWAACRLLERGMRRRDVEALLVPTAVSIGLSEVETRRTIASAQGRAVA